MTAVALKKKMSISDVGRHFDSTLAQELENPTLTAPALTVVSKARQARVAGFSVADPIAEAHAREKSVSARRESVAKLNADKAAQRDVLEKAGVPFLAQLPKTHGENLFIESGLIVAAPDENGSVRYSSEIYEKAGLRGKRLHRYKMVGLSVLNGLIGSFLVQWLTDFHFVPGLIGFALGAGIWLVIEWACDDSRRDSFSKDEEHKQFWSALALRGFSRNRKKLKEMLWPNNREPSTGGYRIPIVLPEAPAEVQEVLLKAAYAKLSLKVAVHPDLVGFAEDPSRTLLDNVSNQWRNDLSDAKNRDESRIRVSLDPIVYHVHGSSIAVLAQFGENPIEEAVVHRIINSQMVL